jgi:large subunit ribosomal protein L6
MSRIGTKSISINPNVTVSQPAGQVIVKGPKGELTQTIPQGISLEITDSQVSVKRANNQKQTKAHHGLMRSLIANMIIGVSEGYTKKLELIGTGYRAKKQGKNIILNVGYSNPVEYQTPDGVVVEPESETVLAVTGINKQLVGQVAAEIRKIRKPEPYKGKGIRYQGEIIRRKAGKSTKVGAAA